MKKLILISIMAVYSISIFCQNNPKEQTVLTWGTSYNDYPEYLNGKIKSVHQNCFWAINNGDKLEKGSLLTLKEHQDSSIMQDFDAQFNNEGVLLRNDYLKDNDSVQWSHVNELKDGRVFKENWVYFDTVKAYAVFNYDEDFHITDIVSRTLVPDEQYLKLDLKHDNKGNMLQMIVYDQNNDNPYNIYYTWDESNRVTEIKNYSSTDSIISKYTYNDHGFFDTAKFIRKGKEITFKSSYTYDEKGNWINNVWTKEGNPFIIMQRKYSYY